MIDFDTGVTVFVVILVSAHLFAMFLFFVSFFAVGVADVFFGFSSLSHSLVCDSTCDSNWAALLNVLEQIGHVGVSDSEFLLINVSG